MLFEIFLIFFSSSWGTQQILDPSSLIEDVKILSNMQNVGYLDRLIADLNRLKDDYKTEIDHREKVINVTEELLQLIIKTSDSKIDGGGWKLVRHINKGNYWHKATDEMMGTAVYGTPCGGTCATQWSIKYDNLKYNQFLFASGDEKLWMVASKTAVIGGWYSNAQRDIIKSSLQSTPYKARWYRRKNSAADPYISLRDHGSSWSNGQHLYCEGNRTKANGNSVLVKHNGANVFIRYKA